MWTPPPNANSIASKAMRKEKWRRGAVINQEGAVVNVQVDSAVMRVNQTMMNGVTLQFQVLINQKLNQLLKKMTMSLRLMRLNMLRYFMENRLTGFVNLKTVMLLSCSVATLVLVGICQRWI